MDVSCLWPKGINVRPKGINDSGQKTPTSVACEHLWHTQLKEG